jgi:DNA invertase Pin-like site-specific DNA recombinase
MTTAVYIRVSSPKGQKTDSQRAELEAWIKRNIDTKATQLIPIFINHRQGAYSIPRALNSVQRKY